MAKKKQNKQGGGQQFLSDENFIRQRVRNLEIGPCYITDDITSQGEGFVVVSRLHTGGRISLACYLLDVYCVGVKDSFYRLRMEDYDLDEFIDKIEGKECSYDEAHNWVYGAIDFAEEGGISPDKSFNLTKYFLKEDTDDVPLIEYEYGKDGQHMLICHSNLEAGKYLPQLRKTLGEDGFKYIIGIEPDDHEDEYDDDDEPVSHPYSDDGPPTVRQLVEKESKDELLYMGSELGMDLDENDSEEEIRKKYSEQVPGLAKAILFKLPMEDINILEHLNESDDHNEGVPITNTYHTTILEYYGLAEQISYEDVGDCRIYIAEDFAKSALPNLEEVHNNPAVHVARTVEIFFEGLANLYGEVSLEYGKQRLTQFLKNSGGNVGDIQDIVDMAYNNSLALRKMEFVEEIDTDKNKHLDKTIFFMSRFSLRRKAELHQLLDDEKRKSMKPKEFTDNDILEAGISAMPHIANKLHDKMKIFLERMGCDEKEANEVMFNLWLYANHVDIPSLKEYTIEEYFKMNAYYYCDDYPDEETEKEGLGILYDFMNAMPIWELNGHSIKE